MPIGFDSGIYNGEHHKSILDLADRIDRQDNKKAFIFSTSTVPLEVVHKTKRGRMIRILKKQRPLPRGLKKNDKDSFCTCNKGFLLFLFIAAERIHALLYTVLYWRGGGGEPRVIIKMLTEEGERSRSHGLHITVIRTQALALGIPVVVQPTTWNDYERVFILAIGEFSERGIDAGVFGDIDIDGHRRWVEKVCSCSGIKPCLPLWKVERQELLNELIDVGFKAKIIAVKEGVLGRRFLGRVLDETTVKEIEKAGVDASGEEGEFHTVVTDGPMFSFRLELNSNGQYYYYGYWFLDVSIPRTYG
jgi:uncharacterized protein (TIGR00290 family)